MQTEGSRGTKASRRLRPLRPLCPPPSRPPSRPRPAPSRASPCRPRPHPASPLRKSRTRTPGPWEVRLRLGWREGTPRRGSGEGRGEVTCWEPRPRAHYFSFGQARFSDGETEARRGRVTPRPVCPGRLLGRCCVLPHSPPPSAGPAPVWTLGPRWDSTWPLDLTLFSLPWRHPDSAL